MHDSEITSLTFPIEMLWSPPKLYPSLFLPRWEGARMIGNKIGHRLDPFLYTILKRFMGENVNPNLFTLMGFFSTLLASCFILKRFWIPAGLAIILSGLFDLFDGVIARKLKKVTALGSFLDSVLDRYSDLLLLFTILIDYLKRGETGLVILTAWVSMGTALIPYVRAKAESLQIQCTIGLMERAERIILLSLGALFGWMVPVLWILAVLTHFTVLQRIHDVWKKIRAHDEQ